MRIHGVTFASIIPWIKVKRRLCKTTFCTFSALYKILKSSTKHKTLVMQSLLKMYKDMRYFTNTYRKGLINDHLFYMIIKLNKIDAFSQVF